MKLYSLSISGLTRASQCPASRHLPQEDLDSDDPYAERGTTIHDEIDEASKQMQPVGEDSEAIAAVWPELIYLGRPEVPLAFDPVAQTGRLLPKTPGVHRDYSMVLASEIPGTADVVLDGVTLTVADYKTGYTWHGRPSESLQLGAYAVAYALATQRPLTDGATLAYVYVRDGGAHVELDRVPDLTPTLERIVKIVTDKTEPMATPGDHCRYCSARRYCPAYMLSASVPMLAPTIADIPPERWPMALEYIDAMSRVGKQLDKEIKRICDDNGDIPLGGKVYTSQMVTKEDVDVTIAEYIAPTKIKKSVAKKDLSPDEIEAIREAGGIIETQYKRYYRKNA